jgi:hypothetical protein
MESIRCVAEYSGDSATSSLLDLLAGREQEGVDVLPRRVGSPSECKGGRSLCGYRGIASSLKRFRKQCELLGRVYNGGEISIHESFGSDIERGILMDASDFESPTDYFSEKFYVSEGRYRLDQEAVISHAYRQPQVVLIRSSRCLRRRFECCAGNHRSMR